MSKLDSILFTISVIDHLNLTGNFFLEQIMNTLLFFFISRLPIPQQILTDNDVRPLQIMTPMQ